MIFDELDQYLNHDFPDDYWVDEGLLQAHTLLRKLSPEGWTQLSNTWRKRDQVWQTRCAQILPQGEPNAGFVVLLAMICLGDRKVCVEALDSLREMDRTSLSANERQSVVDAARAAKIGADSVEAAMLERVINDFCSQ